MIGRAVFLALVGSLLLPTVSSGVPFTPGNLIVVRVGDGSTPLTTATAPVFLEERSPATGAVLRTIPLPTAAQGDQGALTLSGTAFAEGALQISPDGNYIVLTGYDQAPGGVPVTGARVVARVDALGNIDTSTHLGTAFQTTSPRGVATLDGTDLWVGGGTGGMVYTTFGSTSTPPSILAIPSSIRAVGIANGQLYATSGTASYTSVFSIGTGLPTSAGQVANVLLSGSASPYGFAFSEDGNVCYVADDGGTAGVQRLRRTAGLWAREATFGPPGRGLGAWWSEAPDVVLYWTGSTSLYRYRDDNGSSPSLTNAGLPPIATAATNTAFRGLVVAPPADVTDVAGTAPPGLQLASSVPNPCRDAAIIRFATARPGRVSLRVYDTAGRLMTTLADGDYPAGPHSVSLDARRLKSGLYFCTLGSGDAVVTRKLLRIR